MRQRRGSPPRSVVELIAAAHMFPAENKKNNFRTFVFSQNTFLLIYFLFLFTIYKMWMDNMDKNGAGILISGHLF